MLVIMEGSSESAWEKSDSFRALNPPSISGWNLRLVHSDRVGFPGYAHKDSGFRKARDVVPTALIANDRNQEGFCGICEEDVSGDPFIRPTEPVDLCLREWLDKPDRSIDEYECLHIFRQILDIVNIAHSEGVVLHNIRPSCFVLSSYNHVTLVESTSFLGSESISLGDGLRRNNVAMHEPLALGLMSDDFPSNITTNTSELFETSSLQSRLVYEARRSLIEENEGNKVTGRRYVEQEEKKLSFPLKKTMLIESSWYTSPEELDGLPSSCASDVYCLGVLLFELFCEFKSREEKSRTMSSLRNRVLPPQLLLKWPKEASFCLLLLQPDPSRRPKVSELLQSEFLNEPREDLQNREASLELEEKIEDQELLLEFLYLIRQKKQDAADNLQDALSFLSLDILEVKEQQSNREKKGGCCSELGKADNTASNFYSSGITGDDNCATSGSRKRYRPGPPVQNIGQCDDDQDDTQKPASSEKQESPLLRCSRLMKNFKKLESAYFLTRRRPTKKPSAQQFSKRSPINSNRRSSLALTRSSVHNSVTNERYAYNGPSKWIDPFLEGLCKYMAFSKLRVKADLNQGDLLNSSSLVCSLGFDRDGEFFATAGVNKKIKVFECNTLVTGNREIHYPAVEMTSKSKLSSICWNTYIKGQIASSNFEGVVQIWDVTRGQVLMEMAEHEKRVWSIDFSSSDPTLLASGSDDGSVKLWNINQGVSIGTINLKANVCCVQFSPDYGRFLAFGSADHKIHYYDLRNSRIPLCTLAGHSKAVSYVKFVDSVNLVSASTDNTLKLWDLSTFKSHIVDTPTITFTGHTNVKNFVGLSASDGYIATGSETNEVFIYQKAFPMPALSFKFGDAEFVPGQDAHVSGQFISSVCWRGQSSTLVAASSTGNIKILEMV